MPVETQKRQQITTTLLSRESIGKAYHVLTFDVPEGVPARAGQFCMIHGSNWGSSPLLPRPMSYLAAGTNPSILVKVFGEGTRRMAYAEPGEPFTMLGPLGNTWPVPTPGKQPLLVGGGVGIAPLLFLARELHATGVKPAALYGGRSKRDLPLDDELAEISTLRVTTEDGSDGDTGRVTDVLGDLLTTDTQVFTCGPDRMMAAVAKMCERVGVDCFASLETPMACGYGVCLGCPVPTRKDGYIYACMQGPCVNAKAIDWDRMDAPGRAGEGSVR